MSTAKPFSIAGTANHQLRNRLRTGDFAIGLTITTNSLEAAVLSAKLGFHFLWVEMEHSPVSLGGLRAIVLATTGLILRFLSGCPWLRCGPPSAYSIWMSVE